MATSYVDELKEWVQGKGGNSRARNLVTFLVIQDDVLAAREAGFSVKAIWAHMSETGRVKFGYETFLGYVMREEKKASQREASGRESVRPAAGTAARRGKAAVDFSEQGSSKPAAYETSKGADPLLDPVDDRPPAMPTFSFNPVPTTKR